MCRKWVCWTIFSPESCRGAARADTHDVLAGQESAKRVHLAKCKPWQQQREKRHHLQRCQRPEIPDRLWQRAPQLLPAQPETDHPGIGTVGRRVGAALHAQQHFVQAFCVQAAGCQPADRLAHRQRHANVRWLQVFDGRAAAGIGRPESWSLALKTHDMLNCRRKNRIAQHRLQVFCRSFYIVV